MVGSLLTGVIGAFVIVACAATLQGHPVQAAGDAAAALQPLAGSAASVLFGVGLLGAALLVARDPALMGDHALSRTGAVLTAATFAGIAACVIALGWLSL